VKFVIGILSSTPDSGALKGGCGPDFVFKPIPANASGATSLKKQE
jgi:hypothetical protein